MAKGLFGGLGRGAAMAAPAAGGFTRSLFPAGAGAAAAGGGGGLLSRIFPGMAGGGAGGGLLGRGMTQGSYDMTMAMLQNAMAGVQDADSPALSFLAPLIGSMVGRGAERSLNRTKADEARRMSSTVLGPLAQSPQVAGYLDVLNNPNAPDYLKTLATAMLKDATKPAAAGGGRRRASGGAPAGGGGAKPPRFTYIMRDPDGVVRGYNPATGRREPVPTEDAPPAVDATDPLGLRAPVLDDPLGLR